MSELGLGTFLGDFSDEQAKQYQKTIYYAMTHGVRYMDTAINYRGMRSQRDIGHVIQTLKSEGKFERGALVLSSKAGFIPGDGQIMLRPKDYLKENFLDPGILTPGDIYHHQGSNLRMTLHPDFYTYAIDLSLKQMNLDYLDVHFIHEPELTKEMMGKGLFYEKLSALIDCYERQVTMGKINNYGFATWESFQLDPDDPRYLSLEDLLDLVKATCMNHHFNHLMMPYSILMPEAGTLKTQRVKGKWMTALEAAKTLGFTLYASGAIGQPQGQEICDIKERIHFLKKCPHLDVAFIGSKKREHLIENQSIFYD